MAAKERPPYGRRLLPLVLDEFAEKDPNRLYASIPKTADVTEGFRDITVKDIARCVDFMSKWIEDKFGRSNDFETITYIGIPDLRASVIFHATVKCGYKLLLPSPRNPPSTNISLINQTGSKKLLHTPEVAPIVKRLSELDPSIRVEVIPSFEDMLTSNPDPYPYYKKSFEEARDDPILVLHSSGSTGIPKPITMTHGSFATFDNEHNIRDIPGRKHKNSTIWSSDSPKRVYTVFPFFHLAGFTASTVTPIFRDVAVVLGPPHLIPDVHLLKDIMKQQKLWSMFLVPAIIEELLNEPGGIDLFKDLEILSFSGAPSNPSVGDRLSKVVDLYSPFGSTETFSLPELALPREDWAWHEFHPDFKYELQIYDPNEGTYELVIFADESNKDFCAIYHNLPGVTEYRTRDLFTQHPERPRLYKYYGRRDDIIVLANGEKVNPVPLEISVQSQASLKGALVIGNGRTSTSLLVEPKEPLDEAGRSKLLEDIWPVVEKSNSLLPGQGRIRRGNIICASPNKPFARTGKGTVVRKLTEQAYEEEINRLYTESSSSQKTVTVNLVPSLKPVYELPTITEFLRNIIAASFTPGSTIGETEDFFEYGLDSVQTLEITSNLKRNLQGQTSRSVSWISPRTIFRNSTLARLSRVIAAFLNEGTIPEEDSDLVRTRVIDETVAEYVGTLPEKPAVQATSPSKVSTVALIGSTGYLGPYVLLSLLKDPNISQVYCLNRANDAQQKQTKDLLALDSTIEPHLGKLVYLTISLGKPSFGLSKDEYDTIAQKVDVIVYNSWRLDFGLSIQTFSPFLRATRDLVDLSVTSNRNIHIVFISSIASIGAMAGKTTVPEAPVDDPLAAVNMGYGQSKFAAERILTVANQRCKVPVTIVRIGQVGGPSAASTGVWADQQWISALVKTAKTLKTIPGGLAPVDWVPVDTVAAMLHKFILNTPKEEVQVFNICHPRPQPWGTFIKAVKSILEITEEVPLREYVKRLRDITNVNPDVVAKIPALKLLDYYDSIGDGTETFSIATDRALEVSGVDIPDLNEEVLEGWLRSWNV